MATAQEIGKSDPRRRVGSVTLAGAAILAPMAGITDLGMRRAARRFGATLAFSEMVASAEFLARGNEARLRAEGEGAAPHAAQLVGADPLAMAEAARRLEGAGARLIDINMGCPSRRVAGRLAGCALMRDLDQAAKIDRGGGLRGSHAGQRQDAARLGRGRAQRGGAGAPRRGGGRGDDHRSCADPQPNVRRARRLGARSAKSSPRCARSGRRQRRLPRRRRRAGDARPIRRAKR